MRVLRLLSAIVPVVALVGCSSAEESAPAAAPRSAGASPTATAVARFAALPASSSSPVRSTAGTGAGAGCSIFPADNVWHADVGAPIGIPITTVPANQGTVRVTFQYRDESDPGPYPVPATAAVEGGTSGTGDRHVIVDDPAHCRDYELFAAHRSADGSWQAGSGSARTRPRPGSVSRLGYRGGNHRPVVPEGPDAAGAGGRWYRSDRRYAARESPPG